jgi:hypothetical protein
MAADDGSRLVQLFASDGRLHQFPLGKDTAEALGRDLLAPSVEVAQPGQVPPTNGKGPLL